MKKTYCHKIHQKLHNPGDPVWYYQYQRKVSLNPKLQRPWHGPFVAIERLNDVMYCIKLSPRSQPKVVHHDKLSLMLVKTDPLGFKSRQVSVSRSSDGFTLSLKILSRNDRGYIRI